MRLVSSLRYIALLVIFLPFATAGYFFDDTWNGLTRGTLLYFDITIHEHFQNLFRIWTIENGRFFPVSLFAGVYGWYFLEELSQARAYQLTLAALNVWMWFGIIRTISNSKLLAWKAIIFLGLVIQFNPRWDGLTSFVALNQMVLFFIQLSVLCVMAAYYFKQGKYKVTFLSLSLTFCAFSLLTYEIGILGPALVTIFLVFQLKEKTHATLVALLGVFSLVSAYMIIALFLRNKMSVGYTGTEIEFGIASIKTFSFQVLSALPLANVRDLGDSYKYVGGLWFLAIYFIVSTACFVTIGNTHCNDWKKINQRPLLFLIALTTLTVPALLISLSARYQDIIKYGDPYIVVYVQFFGASLLLALVFSSIQRRLIPTIFMQVFVAGLIGFFIAVTVLENFGKIDGKNKQFKYPREQTETLFNANLFKDLG